MPTTWLQALHAYRYPVDLSCYSEAARWPGWFCQRLSVGDVQETKRLKARFREHGAVSLEVWYEVAFWKMYSQDGRREGQTRRFMAQLLSGGATAAELWDACASYVAAPSREIFDRFRRMIGYRTPVIATVATFPAFMAPTEFPMVDTRVAKWVRARALQHNAADPLGPQLKLPQYPDNGATVLTMQDWEFVASWTNWSRHMASKLSEATHREWRARDVEMAVLNAQGDSSRRPAAHLTALGPGR